ncbi:pitrilysin family protein [Halalkalibacterium halodurans]|uniref:Zinc protease n=1 Tax=Halalkalibacterium halodurans TaxID=86665 RepID=A0A0M0KJ65_ALKHA|nr:pitrilysin family protein [Halalkalibacterium halodurans]MED3646230.1 pitrilysin family protein [Halalkalibacterium halodurans]MED4080058.1 pitrilysin family protein [Halalkalibacterium halodurans]MED4086825.1 pitrilysin family protein [Halalkalibacterium halodurans]MED4104263.1 pitrilysin family protein [Halalkalibacterium halodurans]MED4110379.1 pitrilysin family protein [Halalkalibacterium halodurans]
MNELQESYARAGGLHVHLLKTDKYKTNTLMLMVKAPLEKETVAKRALLANVLQNSTAKSPTRSDLRNRLDDLYGATLATDVQKKGEQHIITIRLDVANEEFLSDSTPLFEKGLSLLAEVLLEPKVSGNKFDEAVVKSEKRSLLERIESLYDDKMRYSSLRVTEEMCKDEPFGLSVYGTREQVEQLSAEELYRYYEQMLHSDRIDLFVLGEKGDPSLMSTVEDTFSKLATYQKEAKTDSVPASIPSPEVKEAREVIEKQDVKQGKLNIGFRAYTTYGDPDYVAMQVMNGLFGGFSHSKLFINVREKESLAYYAASRFESHKGLLIVMSGIEFTNYEKAVTIIKEQLEEMKNGRFTDKELEQTKAMLKNQLLETADVPRGQIEVMYHNIVSNHERTLEKWLAEIDAITKEQVVAAANKVVLDTIYFLKGEEQA